MKTDYKAIKGIGTGAVGFRVGVRSRLFESPDHLLLVQSSGYSEEYKRVFYRDVRYIVARQSSDQTVLAIFCAAGFLIGCLFFWGGLWVVGCMVVAPFILGFIVNILRGSTCRVFVNTEVQTLELPAPRRFGKLPLFVHFLRSRLPTAQPPVERVVT